MRFGDVLFALQRDYAPRRFVRSGEAIRFFPIRFTINQIEKITSILSEILRFVFIFLIFRVSTEERR